MDQERIGKFICELRKEKNMTQQELADKLNVTDRAVSHWENGRRLPDYSLLSELCEVLSVSINELFLGERISNEKYKEKAEENMSKLIKDYFFSSILVKSVLWLGSYFSKSDAVMFNDLSNLLIPLASLKWRFIWKRIFYIL